MNQRRIYRVFRRNTLLSQLLLLSFLIQILLSGSLISPHMVTASPQTYPDNVWEGAVAPNDSPQTAWDLSLTGSESKTNNPDTPLNVSTTSPDYYNFTVYPGFYFQVYIEFNHTAAYNTTGDGQLINLTKHPDYYADIDLELYAQNGTLLGESKGLWDEEAIGPIKTTNTEEYLINVSAVNWDVGDTYDYSVIYNMSVVFDDIWEIQKTNDNVNDLDDPRPDKSTDDEILPGTYNNLRFSSDQYTEYGLQDWYYIWFYNETQVNITVTAYSDPAILEINGPHIKLNDENQSSLFTYEDPNLSTDTKLFQVNYTGWYFLGLDNSPSQDASYYSLYIDIEDDPEFVDGDNNEDNSTATKITDPGHYYGMVIAEDDEDWYKIWVDAEQRILVDVQWFPFIGDLDLTLYANDTIPTNDSIAGEAIPIFNGLRIGPHRAFQDIWYFIHISGDNADDRYYNLTITIEEIDDRYEDNDIVTMATFLPTKTHIFKPTVADPWAGLFSLKGDVDWFAMSLLPGDILNITINFDNALGDLNLFLYDSSLNLLNFSTSTTSQENVGYSAIVSDIYLFVVNGSTASYAQVGLDYNMTVEIQEFDDHFESNDEANTAAPISEGNHSHLILRDSDDDWYKVYLGTSDVITINLTFFAEKTGEYLNDIDLDLLDINQVPVNQSRTLFNESLTYTTTSPGIYYILCVIDGSSNYYNLTIDILETDDAHEDNDVLKDATRLDILDTVPSETISRVVRNLKIRIADDDYFVTSVPAGLAIIIETTFGSSANIDLELLYSNGTVIDASNQITGTSEIVGPFPINTEYLSTHNTTDIYFRVLMYSGDIADYTLNVTIGPEDILIPRETVPKFTPSIAPPFDWLGALIVVGGGAAVIGGGTAYGLYFAKKKGKLDKPIKWFKDRFGRGGTDGTEGTGGLEGAGGNGD